MEVENAILAISLVEVEIHVAGQRSCGGEACVWVRLLRQRRGAVEEHRRSKQAGQRISAWSRMRQPNHILMSQNTDFED